MSRTEWISNAQQRLLTMGCTGDTACEMAHGLADLFYPEIDPAEALERAARGAATVTINPDAPLTW